MDSEQPFIEVQKPDGNKYIICLEEIIQQGMDKNSVTVGRCDDNNIVLPDPHRKISRHHCAFERELDQWWIVDELSANGTFLRQCEGKAEIDVRKEGRLRLKNGDEILILAKLLEKDKPVFWQLTFRDPGDTEQVEGFEPPAELEYSLSQKRLFRVSGGNREEIDLYKLRPQERTLIHYMAQHQVNKNQSVIYSYEELIKAIWGDPFGHTNNEITRIVWGMREQIESDSGEPKFLQTVRGQGYRLVIKILS